MVHTQQMHCYLQHLEQIVYEIPSWQVQNHSFSSGEKLLCRLQSKRISNSHSTSSGLLSRATCVRHTHWYSSRATCGCNTVTFFTCRFLFKVAGMNFFKACHHLSMACVPPQLLNWRGVVATRFAYSWSWCDTWRNMMSRSTLDDPGRRPRGCCCQLRIPLDRNRWSD